MKNYQISVGNIGNLECDFIIRKMDDYFYAQVAMTIMEEKTANREYEPFMHIRDNYPKYLVTMDRIDMSKDGIIHLNLYDFLMGKEKSEI